MIPAVAPQSLRIVSYNIRKAMGTDRRRDPERIMRIIRSLHADVVVLQEADPPHFEVLSADLPHGRFDPGEDHTGMGIALRSPAKTSAIPYS